MRILVVDDDLVSRRLMTRLLQPLGSVETAADGQQALELFAAALDEQDPFDLVTLDIVMPVVDGHTALREMRRLEHDAGVGPDGRSRIVMATTLDDVRHVRAAFRGLCDDYLIKPVRAAVLLERLEELGIEV